MADFEKQQDLTPFREKVAENVGKIDKPAEQLADGLSKLTGVGGFDLMEAVIEGVQSMNPERKARKRIFLTEAANKAETGAATLIKPVVMA